MLVMENAEEVLQILERFSKLKQKDIPKELDEYLIFVAKTGDTVYRWPMIKYLFREKLMQVIQDFRDSTPSLEAIPHNHNLDLFNYEPMKNSLLERLEGFHAAPFTVQRLCELLTDPRKQYSRIDKFMRAIEKNILVVTTTEPGRKRGDSENADSIDSVVNGDVSSESVDSDETDIFFSQDIRRHVYGEHKHKMLVAEITKNLLDSMDSEKEKDKDKDDNEIKVDTETETTTTTTTTAAGTNVTKQDDESLDDDKKKFLDEYKKDVSKLNRCKLSSTSSTTSSITPDTTNEVTEATTTTTTASSKADSEVEQPAESVCEGVADSNNKTEKLHSEPITSTSERETLGDEIVRELEKAEAEAEAEVEANKTKLLIDTTTAEKPSIEKLKELEEEEEELLLLPDETESLPNSTVKDDCIIKDIKLIPIIISGIESASTLSEHSKIDEVENDFSSSSVSDDKSDNSNDAPIEKDEENISSDASSISETDEKEKIDKDDNLLEDYISESDTKSSEDDSELSTDLELKQETKKIKLSDVSDDTDDKKEPEEKKLKLDEDIANEKELIDQQISTSSDLKQHPITSIITSSTSNTDIITSTDDLLLNNKTKIIDNELIPEKTTTDDDEIFMESTTTDQLLIDDIKLQSDSLITTSSSISSSPSSSSSLLFPNKVIDEDDDSNVLSTTTTSTTTTPPSSLITNEIIMQSTDTLEMDTSIQTITSPSSSSSLSLGTEMKMSTDDDDLIVPTSSSILLTNKLDDTAMDVDETIEPMDQ